MKKIIITEEIKKEITNKFNSGISARKLANEYQYSFTVIQKLIHSHNHEQQIDSNYPQKDGYYMIAICKKTKKEYNDYNNNSGALTELVFNLYPEESKKSKFIRKSKEYITGKFWYDEYFTFEYRKNKALKKCDYCDWTTEDINNLAGAYEKHLITVHNITPEEHVKIFTEDEKYFKKLPPKDGVICAICGKKLKILNYKHLMRKHNVSLWEYKLKYGDSGIVSESTKEKLNEQWTNNLKNQGFIRTSSQEKEILLLLNKETLISSDRKILNGQEIDIYDTELRIGIEINGVYYHSEINGKKDRMYHLNKSVLAEENKVQLIQIFEDEILYKKNIVISRLKHILNINDLPKIFARKCIIKPINNIEASNFYEENHIQGYSNSKIHVGLMFENEIVSIMSFDNNRNMNKELNHNTNTYELTRFATNNKYIVVGAGGKLLKHFISTYKPAKIISFADRRWTPSSINNIYTKLGFKLTKTIPPDYSYLNGKISRYKRLHKFGFGKSSLKKKFPEIYNNNKTEWEMMRELGYDRIWDCGKFKYELTI